MIVLSLGSFIIHELIQFIFFFWKKISHTFTETIFSTLKVRFSSRIMFFSWRGGGEISFFIPLHSNIWYNENFLSKISAKIFNENLDFFVNQQNSLRTIFSIWYHIIKLKLSDNFSNQILFIFFLSNNFFSSQWQQHLKHSIQNPLKSSLFSTSTKISLYNLT